MLERMLRQKKKEKETRGHPGADPVIEAYADDTDPFLCRLPALVMEMRQEHEEVVPPKGWIFYAILPFIPLAGTLYLLLAARLPGIEKRKNIKNYALSAGIVSAIFTAGVIASLWLLVFHGHAVRVFLLSLKGA